MLPSLRQFQFLVALADELHFGRAAQNCNVSQSTLSAGLKELETILGVPLAERTKRSVLLTSVGAAVAARARVLLRDAQEISELARYQAGAMQGDIRVGAIPTLGPYLLPKLLPRLRERYPHLRLFLREELTDSLIAGLREGRLDAILIALPYEIGDLETSDLFEDGYQLAMPEGDHMVGARYADLQTLTDAALRGEKLMLLERGHCLQQHALSAFPESGLVQDETFAATSLSTLVSMVEEGLAITLLPQLAIDAGIARGHHLALRPLSGALPRQVVLAWRRTSSRADDFAKLAELFRQARVDLETQPA